MEPIAKRSKTKSEDGEAKRAAKAKDADEEDIQVASDKRKAKKVTAKGAKHAEKDVPKSEVIIVTVLNVNDVLYGRAGKIVHYPGNVHFRQLVSRSRKEYMSTGRHKAKDKLARRIFATIQSNGGRFLRKHAEEDEQQDSVPLEKTIWQVVEEKDVLQKIKQALREYDTTKSDNEVPAAPPAVAAAAVAVAAPQPERPSDRAELPHVAGTTFHVGGTPLRMGVAAQGLLESNQGLISQATGILSGGAGSVRSMPGLLLERSPQHGTASFGLGVAMEPPTLAHVQPPQPHLLAPLLGAAGGNAAAANAPDQPVTQASRAALLAEYAANNQALQAHDELLTAYAQERVMNQVRTRVLLQNQVASSSVISQALFPVASLVQAPTYQLSLLQQQPPHHQPLQLSNQYMNPAASLQAGVVPPMGILQASSVSYPLLSSLQVRSQARPLVLSAAAPLPLQPPHDNSAAESAAANPLLLAALANASPQRPWNDQLERNP